jgi:transcriptional regulator of acetoin/glycerol metabolism
MAKMMVPMTACGVVYLPVCGITIATTNRQSRGDNNDALPSQAATATAAATEEAATALQVTDLVHKLGSDETDELQEHSDGLHRAMDDEPRRKPAQRARDVRGTPSPQHTGTTSIGVHTARLTHRLKNRATVMPMGSRMPHENSIMRP